MRTISKSKYIIALIIATAVFVIGLLIGILVTEERTKFLEVSAREQKIDFDSLQLQDLYLNTLTDKCPAINKALESNLNNLEQTRIKLENYLSQSLIDDDKEFSLTKREYMLAEMRYWLWASQTKEICDIDTISLLYFYSNNDCEDCVSQGLILTYLKDKFKRNLLIFSLDSDFIEEPMLRIIKEDYNITKVPTIIIGNEKFEGLTKKEELEKVICSSYNKKPSECNEL